MCRSSLYLLAVATIVVIMAGCSTDKRTYLDSVSEEPGGIGSFVTILTPAGARLSNEDFLALPANWGHTVTNGTSLDVLLVRDALAPGSVLQFDPVGVITVDSSGKQKHIIVGVPTDVSLRTVDIGEFEDLITKYEPVRNILQTWIVNYRGYGALELIGWQDEEFAEGLIN